STREQHVEKFTLDNESPIQGEEPQASRDGAREGRVLMILRCAIVCHFGPVAYLGTRTDSAAEAPICPSGRTVAPVPRAIGRTRPTFTTLNFCALRWRNCFRGRRCRSATIRGGIGRRLLGEC